MRQINTSLSKDRRVEGYINRENTISPPNKTEIVTEQKEIIKRMTDFYKASDEIKLCSQVGSLKLIYSNFFKQHQENP